MEKILFKILINDDPANTDETKFRVEERIGYKINDDYAVPNEANKWFVTNLETGTSGSTGKTMKQAMDEYQKLADNGTLERIKKRDLYKKFKKALKKLSK